MLKWLMLTIYILSITYVIARSIQWIRSLRFMIERKITAISFFMIYVVSFLICCSSLLLGGLLPYGPLRIHFHKFSNYWLGFFIYLIFFIFLTDLLRGILFLRKGRKKTALFQKRIPCIIVGLVVIGLSVGFTAYGLVHADHIYTHTYEISVKKTAGNKKDLNIVLIADLHLGYSVGSRDMKQLVEKINILDPDVVFVAGDIVDNEYEAIENPDLIAEILNQIKSRYGVYAVYGNHDVAETLIGGFSITPKTEAFRDPRVEKFVEKCGFTMLEDETLLVDDAFYITGRLDGEKAGDGTRNRRETKNLLMDADHSKPIILLSHEPDDLEENETAGVDLQLSGHTHAGQFFPLNLVQPLVWKNSWGYLKIGNMHNFVTSGVGIYGPDLRVMTDSEIMQIKVHFQE